MKIRFGIELVLAFSFLGLGTAANAHKSGVNVQGNLSTGVDRPLHRQDSFGLDYTSYDFRGIVALNNCSGSIVRYDDRNDTDRALVLTNGHCVDLIDPGVVYLNRRSSRKFNILSEDASVLGSVRASRLLYATMTKTDLALYELRKTYEEITQEFDIDPLTLAREAASTGENIEVISGYWKIGYSCQLEAYVHQLKEGKWDFENSLRYSRPGCLVKGGTSGSPIIVEGTRTVIGVNNTGNESGRKCTLNNPCEINEFGDVFYQKGYSYGQQTVWLYGCRDDEGLDLEIDGCQLPK